MSPCLVRVLCTRRCAHLLAIVLIMRPLAVYLDSDVDTNKELIVHGYSNFLAGIVGTVPNYLCLRQYAAVRWMLPGLLNLLMLAQVLLRRWDHAAIWPYARWCNYRGGTRWHRSDRIYP
jgi:hypothetical protein